MNSHEQLRNEILNKAVVHGKVTSIVDLTRFSVLIK